jgi:GMP synthase-like glutamine amidotransferase
VRYAPGVWGLQFHPEFSAQTMRAYIGERAGALAEEGLDPDRLRRTVAPTPRARVILRRFARHARAMRGATTAGGPEPARRESARIRGRGSRRPDS